MKFSIFFIIYFLFYFSAEAQKSKAYNNWYFGDRFAVTFNSGAPEVLHDSRMNASQGCASISDLKGDLLFYTNGDSIFCKDHSIMENSTPLDSYKCFNSVSGVIIIKKPGCNSLYYVITSPSTIKYPSHPYLSYAIIDMSANSGKGKVISKMNHFNHTTQNQSLRGSLSYVRHGSKNAYWILTTTGDNQFITFLLDETGLDTPGKISNVYTYGTAYYKFSPDGKYLATGDGLFAFDKETGIITKKLGSINNEAFTGNYLEFSSDGSKLYYFSNLASDLLQVDLTKYAGGNLRAERMHVFYLGYSENFNSLMRGPDDKIYILRQYQAQINEDNYYYLSVINKPNLSLDKCDFEDLKIKLGKKDIYSPWANVHGLPMMPPNFDYVESTFANFEFLYDTCSAQFFFDNKSKHASHYLWDFGDGISSTEKDPTHQFLTSGNYKVKLITSGENICPDTIEREVKYGQKDVENSISTYNIFSPNDDGYNDVFKIDHIKCPGNKLIIFNRWGQQILSQMGENLQWDGSFNGKPATEGNYFYLLMINDIRVRQGTLTLIR